MEDYLRDLFDLNQKNAVVIGGGGGIGKEIAKGLAFYGTKVAIASRSEINLKKAAEEIEESIDKKIVTFTVDAGDHESIKSLVNHAVDTFGRVDILVNSQGINLRHNAFEMPVKDWDDTFNINVRGVMLCCIEFAREMKKHGYGRIINLSSVRAYGAAPGGGMALAYGCSKAAVNMITKQLAAEFAPFGITVNAIAPTVVKTDMLAQRLTPEFEARMSGKIPLGRIGLPEDIIGPAVFLASDASSYITGSCLYVDGGLTNIC